MSRSQFMVRVWIWKICVRDSRSGSPNSTFLSRRPGLNNAGSSVSGLLVAISTCINHSSSHTPVKHIPSHGHDHACLAC